jgi:hypothetical protein
MRREKQERAKTIVHVSDDGPSIRTLWRAGELGAAFLGLVGLLPSGVSFRRIALSIKLGVAVRSWYVVREASLPVLDRR